MTSTAGVLALLSANPLRDEVDRIAAAAGTGVVHLDPATPLTGKTWAAAGAVVLDGRTALRIPSLHFPRRSDVFVVMLGELDGTRPDSDILGAAIEAGAQNVFVLPGQAADLVGALSRIGESAGAESGCRPVAAVIGGRGGAGSSLFAAALALSASGSLLIDLDPWGGGIDLLIGGEAVSGLRWPDIGVRDGRLNWSDVRAALPRHRGVSVLSGSRRAHDIPVGAVDAVIGAGRIGAAAVVCDLPRQLSDAARTAVHAADLVVVVASCDVRCCAATAKLAPALTSVNPNVGLVVRGPSPGGLGRREIADIVGLPLLAAMRPEPMLDEKLERSGLRLHNRSPLGKAAREVLSVLQAGAASPREWAA